MLTSVLLIRGRRTARNDVRACSCWPGQRTVQLAERRKAHLGAQSRRAVDGVLADTGL